MAKLTLTDITAGFGAESAINANNALIEAALQNNVLYRDNSSGEANEMNNHLDMNGYNLLNVGNFSSLTTGTASPSIIWGTQYDGTGTHSLTVTLRYRYTEISSSSSITAVALIDTEANVGWENGNWVGLVQKGVGQIRVQAGSGVTIRTPETYRTNKQYSTVRALYRGSDVWYLEGDLETTA